MKRKEILEMKNKAGEELKKMAADFREKLEVLSFDLESGKVKNVREIREIKKNIARILTFLRMGTDNKEKKTVK